MKIIFILFLPRSFGYCSVKIVSIFKILAALTIFALFTSGTSFAANAVVESLCKISSNTAQTKFRAKVLEDAQYDDNLILKENTVINGKIVKTVDAKRGKRNGYIIIQPVSYEYDNIVNIILDESIEAKVIGYSKKDYKKMGLNAGLAVGGLFVKGAGQIFYFSKGLLIPDENKSRISTAVSNVYENSPFIYIEKGKDVDINEGDLLVIKFYNSDDSKQK